MQIIFVKRNYKGFVFLFCSFMLLLKQRVWPDFVINSRSQLNNVCKGFNTVSDSLQALNKKCYYS